ncbi:MAG: mechanosensitive ion channel family protein [Thermoleophilia bacterium]|nr:mechanosensitive ion channel family protein [Thermoleophilia bacterium]
MLDATIKSFVDDNTNVIRAVVIFVVALAIAKLVDVFVTRNASRVTGKIARDEISQATVTRLRLVRRLVFAAIVLVGLGLALAQIDALRPLANTLLASSAVVGITVGLAARGPLANGVAGMMLATVQPFRIGDVIEWDGNRGRVEDITLTYTFIRLPTGHRLVVPNENIATGPLENFTIAGDSVDATASVWVTPPHATPALELLRKQLTGVEAQLGDCEYDRIELKLGFKTSARQEAARRGEVLERAIALLNGAGMLETPAR